MRILYFSIGHVAEGVRKKLEAKIYSFREQGVDATLCWVASNILSDEGKPAVVIPVKQSQARFADRLFFFWRFSVVLEQYEIYKTIGLFLKGQQFDFLLFRYPIADYFLWKLMSRYRGKVIFEHNTIEERELRIRQSGAFYYRYFYWSERVFGRRVRAWSGGLISVTPEITRWQKGLAPGIPCETITNGINVDGVKLRNGAAYEGNELRLLLLAGSAAPWHGVDILLNSLKEFSGDVKIHCYIAGNIMAELKTLAESMPTVTLLPGVTGDELDKLVEHCHIGIDSSFLTQASTLKVREYWSRGLPFILGYEDADLVDRPAMRPFYLRVTQSEKIIDLHEIISFALRVYSIPFASQEMRKLAFMYIDYRTKMKAYIHFINQLPK
jgi:hypothetical protein